MSHQHRWYTYRGHLTFLLWKKLFLGGCHLCNCKRWPDYPFADKPTTNADSRTFHYSPSSNSSYYSYWLNLHSHWCEMTFSWLLRSPTFLNLQCRTWVFQRSVLDPGICWVRSISNEHSDSTNAPNSVPYFSCFPCPASMKNIMN